MRIEKEDKLILGNELKCTIKKGEIPPMIEKCFSISCVVKRLHIPRLSNLDKIRLAVKVVKVENKYQAIKLFTTYINNRLIKLGMKEAYQNAILVEHYYKLNSKPIPKVPLEDILKLTRRDSYTSDMDIDTLELIFKSIIDSMCIEDSDLFDIIGVLPSAIFDHHLGEPENDKVDIKVVFKTLEELNKKVSVMYKVNGYLKELRVKQFERSLK